MTTFFVILIILSPLLFFYAAWKADKKRIDKFDKDINDIINGHLDFIKSLTPRQLEYYKSLDHGHLSRNLVELEQRIHELEKPNLPH